MANISKRELIVRITDRLGLKGMAITQADTQEILRSLLDEIADCLSQGDTVVLRRFGVFEVREIKPRIGRNPKDPDQLVRIPAKAAVRFKAGGELKEKVAPALQVLRERTPATDADATS